MSGARRPYLGRPGRVRRTWARHPRAGLAVKAALAAALAWHVALLLPLDPAQQYPYYAPLGAVIATSTTLSGSVRGSLQSVAAIALGAALALGVSAVLGDGVGALAVVTAASVLLAGWRLLGSSGSWTATSALFVLVLGTQDSGFVVAYTGLTAVGAVIGLAVTAAFPPLPLAPAAEQLQVLRDTLAGQLEDLADGLQQEHPPTEDEWRRRTHRIDPVLAQMREAVQRAAEARRGNRRARHHRAAAEAQYRQARALERLSLMVEQLTQVIAETERADFERVALGPALRPPAARTLAALAAALRSVQDAAAEPEAVRRAQACLHEFADAVRHARATSADDLFVAGDVVQTVQRSLDALPVREPDGP
ncbi:FUSC family protein [Geodermatophilus sp. URMC 63]